MRPTVKEAVSTVVVIGVVSLWFYQELAQGVQVDYAVKTLAVLYLLSGGIVLFGKGVMTSALSMRDKMSGGQGNEQTEKE